MATITLEYDAQNLEAQQTLDSLLSNGLFKRKKLIGRKNGLDRALEDVRKGRVYTYNHFEDLLKEINA